MHVRLDPPGELRGSESEKLRQLHGYLFRLAETLNASPGDAAQPGEAVGSKGKAAEHAVYVQLEKKLEPLALELAALKKAPVYPVSVE